MPQVKYIARRIHEHLPKHVPFEDLLQAGIVGLTLPAARDLARERGYFNNPVRQKIHDDWTEHQGTSGYHKAIFMVDGWCYYNAMPNTNKCETVCSNGLLGQGATEVTPAIFGQRHQTNYTTVEGSGGTNGGSVECETQEAVAVRSCPVAYTSCDVSVTISGNTPPP